MVGVLLVSHGPLARAMKETVEMIYGPTESFWSLEIESGEHPDVLKAKILNRVESLQSVGCLILTDMLGGTPSNATAEVLCNDHVQVLTGANLPMLLSVMARRLESTTLEQLAAIALESGHQGMVDLKEKFLSRVSMMNMENPQEVEL